MSESSNYPSHDEKNQVEKNKKNNLLLREFEANLYQHISEFVDVYEADGEGGLAHAMTQYLPEDGYNAKINTVMNRVKSTVRKEANRLQKQAERDERERARQAEWEYRKQDRQNRIKSKIEKASLAAEGKTPMQSVHTALNEIAAGLDCPDLYIPPGFAISENSIIRNIQQNIEGEVVEIPIRICNTTTLVRCIIKDSEREQQKWRVTYLFDKSWDDIDILPDRLQRDPLILFTSGLPLPGRDKAKMMADYLSAFVAVNYGKIPVIEDTEGMDAFSVIQSWYYENRIKFEPKTEKNPVPWGRSTVLNGIPIVYIMEHKVKNEIEDNGFVWNKILKTWRKNGYIILNHSNKSAHNTTISSSRKVPCLAFVRKNLELSEFEVKALQKREYKAKKEILDGHNIENNVSIQYEDAKFRDVHMLLWPLEPKTNDPGSKAITIHKIVLGANEKEADQYADADNGIYSQYSAVGKAWLMYEESVDKIKPDDVIEVKGTKYVTREIYMQNENNPREENSEEIDEVVQEIFDEERYSRRNISSNMTNQRANKNQRYKNAG